MQSSSWMNFNACMKILSLIHFFELLCFKKEIFCQHLICPRLLFFILLWLVSHTEIQNKWFTKDRLSSSLVGQYFFRSSIAEDQTSHWLIIYISFTLMHQSFSIFCPFLARHEVFISSLAGVWRQNEGKRWASSNHWGKFIIKTIGSGSLLVYYHGLIQHTNMNQIPGSIRFHLSQMIVMDSPDSLLNPRYFTVRECSWGISNKQ